MDDSPETYNDASMLYRDSLEQEIYEEKLAKERARPKKVNNKKRFQCPCIGECVDTKYHIDVEEWNSIQDRRKRQFLEAQKPCTNCGEENEFGTDTGGVCSKCGHVTSDFLEPGFGDMSRVRRPSTGNARRNYFNEVLSQLCRTEPPIPMADRESLVATYNDGFGLEGDETYGNPPRDRSKGRLYDAELDKATVAAIVDRSGVAQNKYVEKWRTIRVLLGAEPNPTPTADELRALRKDFSLFEIKWKQHPELHHTRKSIPCYSFIILQMMLRRSVEMYDTFEKWLPVVTHEKLIDLQVQWAAFCKLLEWEPLFPGKDANGTTIAVPLPELPKDYVKPVIKRQLKQPRAKKFQPKWYRETHWKENKKTWQRWAKGGVFYSASEKLKRWRQCALRMVRGEITHAVQRCSQEQTPTCN